MESALHPVLFLMFKFADTILLMPQVTNISARINILSVKSWAWANQVEIYWDTPSHICIIVCGFGCFYSNILFSEMQLVSAQQVPVVIISSLTYLLTYLELVF